VLVVEDDAAIRELLRLHLDLSGLATDEADDGRKALDRARSQPFDLVLLDVMLPGLDGVSVCRAICNAGSKCRDADSDDVRPRRGVRQGAGTGERRRRYLTKPFGVRELMA
jgi:two-component system response regulator ArlR